MASTHFLIGAAVAAASVMTHAADISATDTIVVTATRTEIAASDATVPVTVISRDDIELSLASDLSELLRFEAGLDIGRNGGPGQAAFASTPAPSAARHCSTSGPKSSSG